MPSPAYDSTPQEVRSFALLQIVLTGVFLVLLFFMLGGDSEPFPPIWLTVVLLVLVAAGGFMAERVWLTASPLSPQTDVDEARRDAVGIFAAQTVRKLMWCEAPVLVGVLMSFVVDHGGWPIAIAGFPGLVLLTWEVWPSPRNTSLTAAMLDSQGAESRLVESFLDT